MQNRVEKLFMATHSRPPTDQEMQRILSVANALECKTNDAFIGVIATLETYSTAYDNQIKKITDQCDIEARRAAKDAAEIAARYATKEAMRELVRLQNETLNEHRKKIINGQKELPISSNLLIKLGAAGLVIFALAGIFFGEYKQMKSDVNAAQNLRKNGFMVTEEGIAIPYNFKSSFEDVKFTDDYIIVRYPKNP